MAFMGFQTCITCRKFALFAPKGSFGLRLAIFALFRHIIIQARFKYILLELQMHRRIEEKEQSTDLLNLAKCWLHCLLYHKALYPSQTFTFKTIYGSKVPVNKSKSVNQYLNNFFAEFQTMLEQVDYLQVVILEGTTEVERYRLLISLPSEVVEYSANQKELEMKKFVSQFEKMFNNQFITENQRTFRLMVGYRFEERDSDNNFIEKWTPVEEKKSQEMRLGTLRTPNLELFCLRK